MSFRSLFITVQESGSSFASSYFFSINNIKNQYQNHTSFHLSAAIKILALAHQLESKCLMKSQLFVGSLYLSPFLKSKYINFDFCITLL